MCTSDLEDLYFKTEVVRKWLVCFCYYARWIEWVMCLLLPTLNWMVHLYYKFPIATLLIGCVSSWGSRNVGVWSWGEGSWSGWAMDGWVCHREEEGHGVQRALALSLNLGGGGVQKSAPQTSFLDVLAPGAKIKATRLPSFFFWGGAKPLPLSCMFN